METSARNVFSGKVVAVNSGAVNDEVELVVEGGINIVASITKVSTNNLGLKPGASALALIKASFVLLMNDADKYLTNRYGDYMTPPEKKEQTERHVRLRDNWVELIEGR